jgi:two-component system chemotaxis response regulator CheB
MPSTEGRIRVLVVDDSAVMRKLITNILEHDRGVEVVATAMDGQFALSKIDSIKPDVVTLDVDMPRMDGLTALQKIVAKHRTPVVMLSSLTDRGAALTLRALEMGAVDFVCKPQGSGRLGLMASELLAKVKAAATGRVVLGADCERISKTRRKKNAKEEGDTRGRVIAIGASSGGPYALRQLLPRLPADFGAGVVIVQHMPESFTRMLANWLDEICELEVHEARPGDRVVAGRVLIGPSGAHITVKRGQEGAEIVLEKGHPVNGHMPSVEVLFRSMAVEFGSQAVGVIMTGMGSDGAEGLGRIREAGGYTLAQDRDSCAVYGMPRAAIDRGYVDEVLTLSEIASRLKDLVGRQCKREDSYARSRW